MEKKLNGKFKESFKKGLFSKLSISFRGFTGNRALSWDKQKQVAASIPPSKEARDQWLLQPEEGGCVGLLRLP